MPELTYKKSDLVKRLKDKRDEATKKAEAWVEKKKKPRANAIEKLEELLAYAKDPENTKKPKFSTDQAVSGRFQSLLESALSVLPGEGASVDASPESYVIKELTCKIDTLELATETEITIDTLDADQFVASCL